MVRAGVDPELIGRAAAALAEREPVLVADEQAERKRAADRERMRIKREADKDRAMSRDIADERDMVPPKKETSPAPLKEKTTPSSEPNGSSKIPTRLPPDFAFPAEWRQWAITRGLPADRCELEFTKLVNWAANAPGSKGAKRDWFKAWQNWALTAIDQLPNARGSPARKQQPKGSDFFDIEAERLRNERAGNGRSDQGNWDDAQGFPQLTIEHHR
jgi:hypothetical protein